MQERGENCWNSILPWKRGWDLARSGNVGQVGAETVHPSGEKRIHSVSSMRTFSICFLSCFLSRMEAIISSELAWGECVGGLRKEEKV